MAKFNSVCAAALAAFSISAVATGREDDRDRRADPALVAARQKIFGVENVDARTGRVRGDKVIFSWITNASFAASVGYQKVQDAMSIPEEQRAELMWLVDPNDYLRPLVFDPKDDRWRKPGGDRDDR